MSPPAQKARPAPVRTITRTSSSPDAAHIALCTSSAMTSVHAFNCAGRFKVMVAMRSLTSTMISCGGMMYPDLRIGAFRGMPLIRSLDDPFAMHPLDALVRHAQFPQDTRGVFAQPRHRIHSRLEAGEHGGGAL